MNKEILFAQKLEEVKTKARAQGNMITKEQVKEYFAELSLAENQLELVYDFLSKHKIGIGESADLDSYLSEEEVDYLKEYMDGLQEVDTLTDGQKQALFLSAMAGEASAQEQLILFFLPKVIDIAKLYTGQGVYLEDLIGQGNMALSEGVTLLNAQENASQAESMLVSMIMDSMEELIRESIGNKGMDQKIVDKVNEVAAKAKELAQEFRRSVTVSELAQETGMSEEEILDAYRVSGYAIEDLTGGES